MSRHQRRLIVTSDQSLVAEAVRTTLLSHAFDASVAAWPTSARTAWAPGPRGSAAPDVALMMSDLEPSTRLREAQSIVLRVDVPWLVLTTAPRGPLWGAMLESGVEMVLPSSTSLDTVVGLLGDLADGRSAMPDIGKQALVREWRVARAEKELLVERIHSLTPRERTVLRLMFAGDSVRTIAGLLDVSEATVRSHVKAVLRKLAVNSQLAAVAAYGWLEDDRDPGSAWEQSSRPQAEMPRHR